MIYFPSSFFPDNPSGHGLEEKIIYGVENSSTFLECSPKSQRALVYWQFQKQNDDRKEEVWFSVFTGFGFEPEPNSLKHGFLGSKRVAWVIQHQTTGVCGDGESNDEMFHFLVLKKWVGWGNAVPAFFLACCTLKKIVVLSVLWVPIWRQ